MQFPSASPQLTQIALEERVRIEPNRIEIGNTVPRIILE
jgi:hypothetical protein